MLSESPSNISNNQSIAISIGPTILPIHPIIVTIMIYIHLPGNHINTDFNFSTSMDLSYLIFCILSIFVLLAMSCDKEESSTTFDKMTFPTQLTTSGMDMEPYCSPNGKYIAFFSLRNTYDPMIAAVYFELWLMNYDGSDQHVLISVEGYHKYLLLRPRVNWSHDSKNMLLETYSSYGSEIWRVTIDGDIERLSPLSDLALSPKYSQAAL